MTVTPAVHFIGFRGDEYHSAVRIWGKPSFVHIRWDRRAKRDIDPMDTVIFATGTERHPTSMWNGPDINEAGYF